VIKAGQREIPEAQKAVSPKSPEPQKLNRKFFFIFDLQLNDLSGLAQSMKAAIHLMNTQIQPADEISVCSYQARKGLRVHEYLSTDHATIRRAIEKLRGVIGSSPDSGSTGLVDPSGGGWQTSLAPPPAAATGGLLTPPDSEEGDLPMVRLNYVRTMTEFAKTLRYLPGYKNIVLFSAGLARSTMLGDKILRDAYLDLGREFGASSSPVFSINSLGLRAHKMAADERGDWSLKNLATASGGRYFDNVSQTEEVSSGIQNATDNYYVLGYPIGEKWDGKFHEIKVKVKRPGCVISAQIGYYNPKPFAELSEFEKQLQLLDLAFSDQPRFQSPLELPAVVLPGRDDSGPYLIFMSELPSEVIQEVASQQIEATSIAIDQERNVVAHTSRLVQIPDVSGKQIVCYGLVAPKTESNECVMILRNMSTGKAARARGSARIPEPILGGLRMDQPLFLVPLDDGEVVYFGLGSGDKRTSGQTTLQDLLPFLSNRLKPVMNEIGRATSKLFAIVRCAASDMPNADIDFEASLKESRSGADFPLRPAVLDVKSQGKSVAFLLELALPELHIGDCSLVLRCKDKSSGAKSEMSRTIKVV
jgi:VWFA-related protein